jgi:hypothetical protein
MAAWRDATSSLACSALLATAAMMLAAPVRAERVENGVAVFSALDKVTARISKFEVPLNTTIKFGALKVTPRVCYSRPPTEQPKTTSFVEVDEIDEAHDQSVKRLFTGWMFAESPGLNAVEHPVFDVWLTDCQKPAKTAAVKPAPDASGAPIGEPPAQPDEPVEPRRRVRR